MEGQPVTPQFPGFPPPELSDSLKLRYELVPLHDLGPLVAFGRKVRPFIPPILK